MYQFLVDADTLQRTVQDFVEGFLGDVLNAVLQITLIFVQNGIHLPKDHLALVFPQRYDAALVDAELTVGNNFVEVYLVDIPQTLAAWAGSLWRVERESVGCRIAV